MVAILQEQNVRQFSSIGFGGQAPIVDYESLEDFKAGIAKEFAASAINPISLNQFPFLTDLEITGEAQDLSTPIDDALGTKYTRFGHRANAARFAVVYRNEDGAVFQLKLNQRFYDTGKGKYGKAYRFPAKDADNRSAIFTPAVTLADWRKIAINSRCKVDLPTWVGRAISAGHGDVLSSSLDAISFAGDSPEGGSFWEWVEATPGVNVVLTEGAKKALSLIYQGYAAISLTGCTGGYRSRDDSGIELLKPVLQPELLPFCGSGRKFTIALDQDEKFETRRKVDGAIRKTAKLLEGAGCKVHVALWEQFEGKGIDDAIAAAGETAQEWLRLTIGDAPTAEEFQRRQYKLRMMRLATGLNRNGITPDRQTEGRWIPELPALKPGFIHVLQALMGGGKSTRISADWKIAPNGGITLVLCPLNSLGKQFAEALGFPHIHDYHLDDPAQFSALLTQINHAGGVVLCVESIHRLPTQLLSRVTSVILDEANQVVSGLVKGSTLKERQGEALQTLKWVMTNAIANGGLIILSERVVYDRAIEFIKRLSNCDRVTLIDHKVSNTQGWEVELAQGSTSGWVSRLAAAVFSGKRILAPVASQEMGHCIELHLKQLSRAYGKPIKVMRIDSETNRDGAFDGFFYAPDKWLDDTQPDILILSPSGKTGLSINHPTAFDEVWGHFTCLAPDDWIQMLGRYRPAVPRKVFIVPFVQAYDQYERICNVDGILKRSQQELEGFARRDGLLEMLAADVDRAPQVVRIEQAVQEFNAANATAIGAQKRIAKDYFIKFLEESGHDIVNEVHVKGDRETQQSITNAREEIWADKANLMASLGAEPPKGKDSHYELEGYGPVSKSRAKEVWEFKSQLREEFPGEDFDDQQFCYEAICKERGTLRRGALMQAAIANTEGAQSLEADHVRAVIGGTIRLPHNLPRHALKAKLLKLIGIESLLDGEGYSNSDPRVLAIKEIALHFRDEIWKLFGLNVKETQTPVEIANKLLRKLGLEAVKLRCAGGRGDREWIYGIPDLVNPVRIRLLEAAYTRLGTDTSTILREMPQSTVDELSVSWQQEKFQISEEWEEEHCET